MPNLTWYANPKKPHHHRHIQFMRPLIEELQKEGVKFRHPNLEVSPWHVQCELNGLLVNWWPCAGKAQIESEMAVYGEENVRQLVLRCKQHTEFDLIDEG